MNISANRLVYPSTILEFVSKDATTGIFMESEVRLALVSTRGSANEQLQGFMSS